MKKLSHLFAQNRAWAESIRARDPDFFPRLARQQSPEYLWIGCADSRVPANEIAGLLPGQMFVHRNVANVVVHTDLNCLTVIQFAVDVLKVRHIIVAGHYGCSGVRAAYRCERIGLADNWLRHVQDVADKHRDCVRAIGAIGGAGGGSGAGGGEGADAESARVDRLCELNVIEQVVNVCHTTIVHDAWQRAQPLTVHGWIYGLKDGLLKDLNMTISAAKEVEPAYWRALAWVEKTGAR